MKNNLQSNPLLFKMILLVTCFMMVILYNKSRAADVPKYKSTSTRFEINFNNDIQKNELSIRIKSRTEDILQLFIFSPDGILVKEVPVSTHKITTIKSLKKGYYLYECFDNDERMKSGNLIIK